MSNQINNNTKELSQRTLEELEKYNIAPTPKCYEVMFEYIKDDNIEVRKAFDKCLEAGGIINEAFLLKLQSTVLSYDTIAIMVDTVTEMLTNHMTGLHQSVSSSDEELNIFSAAVDSFSKHIMNKNKKFFLPDDSDNIVDCIVTATDRVRNKIKDLETELEYSQTEIKKLHTYLDSVCQDNMLDNLTSLATRKRIDQVVLKEIRNSVEINEPLSVAFIEVDNYDAFKKKWGQITSEQILRFVGVSIKENIKGRDTAARYSESLFMVTLPKTNADGSCILADYIRTTIERKRIIKKTTGEFLGRVTVSVGVAQFQEGESVGYLITRAEKALSIARANGKNCIIIEGDSHNNTNKKIANG
jgi:diguanylate cyclase